jgi:hypothetical protein
LDCRELGFLIWNFLIVVNPHFPDAIPNTTKIYVQPTFEDIASALENINV